MTSLAAGVVVTMPFLPSFLNGATWKSPSFFHIEYSTKASPSTGPLLEQLTDPYHVPIEGVTACGGLYSLGRCEVAAPER